MERGECDAGSLYESHPSNPSSHVGNSDIGLIVNSVQLIVDLAVEVAEKMSETSQSVPEIKVDIFITSIEFGGISSKTFRNLGRAVSQSSVPITHVIGVPLALGPSIVENFQNDAPFTEFVADLWIDEIGYIATELLGMTVETAAIANIELAAMAPLLAAAIEFGSGWAWDTFVATEENRDLLEKYIEDYLNYLIDELISEPLDPQPIPVPEPIPTTTPIPK